MYRRRSGAGASSGGSGSGAPALTPTAVKTANYNAAAGDLVPVDTTSGNITITLPTAPADKTQVGVKMVTQASTNHVTVNTGGSDVINKTGGSTSGTVTLLNQFVIYQYASATGIWYAEDALPLSGLDARYAATGDSRFTAMTLNTQTANYTAVLGDAGEMVEMNLAGANTLTIPPNSSVAFPVGTIIGWRQYGAGQITITPGAGVTIRAATSLTSRAQYSEGQLTKRGTDEWVASGDLT
jgi:hypothetical protein